jgi:hypothetical protein
MEKTENVPRASRAVRPATVLESLEAREAAGEDMPEHLVQTLFFQSALRHFRETGRPGLYDLLAAIPNGELRHKAVALRLKAQGQKAGFPDTLFMSPRGGFHGAFLECKRAGKGAVSKDQRAVMSALAGQGYFVGLGHGARAMMSLLLRYLGEVDGRYALPVVHDGGGWFVCRPKRGKT